MVVDNQNRFLTQRTHPQMSLVETDMRNGQLILSSFGMEEHVVPKVSLGMKTIATRVFNDPVNAIELDIATNEWISQALDTPCKLVCFPENETRLCKPDVARPGDHTKFADAFPLLIISQASLDDLNSKLVVPVGMDRFRPNLVIRGCEAFAEDQWESIQINGTNIRMLQTCSRCSVPTVDQKTGMLSGPEPIQTLSTYRQWDDEIYFGSNYTAEIETILSVGDLVNIDAG